MIRSIALAIADVTGGVRPGSWVNQYEDDSFIYEQFCGNPSHERYVDEVVADGLRLGFSSVA